ncbi:GlxA family transcriptional regulator [Sciscionella sediminilitoris]|uniref:GlxA family transcriptional regulator n=1 Tax=Sciscionella sediminilitoris TaxID=1445613 RepID=UPI0004DFC392|nr:DJ-1/PfpI family protein [Sciscionella sp. SE31]
MSTVFFLLVPGVHLLDLAGPAQVFHGAADHGYPYRLRYLGEREQVRTAQGVAVSAETDWPEPGRGDLLLVPGWRTGNLPPPHGLGAPVVRMLEEHHARGGRVASVCAGAYALGMAGLLDGRECTTHHELQDALARRFPAARVVRDVLYTVSGPVVTSAGIASGIDLALHLLAVAHGPGLAARVARSMVAYTRRNGHEQQDSAMLRHRSHTDDLVHRAQDVLDERFADRLVLGELARSLGCAERTLTRQFTRATGLTPLRYQQALRLERAHQLRSNGASAETAARTVGFGDARMLRKLSQRARG